MSRARDIANLQSGNVGFGVSPNAPLAILSTSSSYEGLELVTPASDGSGEFHIGVHQSGSSSGRGIEFRRGGSDGMDTLSMAIDASGDVGIGIDSPDDKLHIKNTSGNTSLRIESDGSNTLSSVRFLNDAVDYASGVDTDDSFFIYDNTNSKHRLKLTSSDTIINETGGDIDFRIESAVQPNTFFIEGETGNISMGSIGTPVPSASNYNSACLHLSQAGSSNVGAQLRLTTGQTGHNAGDGSFIAQWSDLNMYMTNQENAGWRFFGNAKELLTLSPTEAVFNDTDEDINFRIVSDARTHMFFVDAGTNRISIGAQSSPQRLVHIKEFSDTATEMVLGHPSGGNEYGGFIRSNSGTAQGLTLGGYFNGTSTERLKIDGNGNTLVRESDLGGTPSSAVALQVGNNTNNDMIHLRNKTSSGSVFHMFMKFDNTAPDDANSYFLQGADSSTQRFFIYSNGNVVNHDNSYGAISDIKLKEQIKDASSQWDDVKALRIRKYKMKEQIANKGDSDNLWKLGVVAQEVEASGMSGLITTSKDFDQETKEDLGTTTKTVKYSILYMKAVKALQEAMTRIETLEAKVAKLEGA